MVNSSKSYFCIRPFNSVVISTDGAIHTCCAIRTCGQIQENSYNIKNNNIEDYWNSNYLLGLRKKFLNNQKPKECKKCWDQEDNLLQSHRLESNFQYKSIFKKNYVKNLELIKKNNLDYPEDIELSITNICNLSCQMCTGKNSSRLLIENNFLKFENLEQGDYDLDEKTKLEIEKIITHDLKLLNLRGGEPLVNKTIIKIIEKLVVTGKSKKMTLHITTNGTTCNNKIINLLREFENVRIMFSIESVGKFNDYIRYPSNWNDIEKNILAFKNLKNAYLYINTVVQNLNLLYLEPLINFANLNKIFLRFSILSSPKYLEFDNLPLDLLKKSYENLNNIDKKKLIHTKNIKEIIKLLKIKIDTHKHDKEKFTMFTGMIKKRDQYRKISIQDYMPEIYNIL